MVFPCRGRLEGVGERVAGFWLTLVDCYSYAEVLLVGTKVVIDSYSFAVSSESPLFLTRRESKLNIVRVGTKKILVKVGNRER